MTKYGLIFEDENSNLVFVGSFVGNNHYRIKFEMFRYIKKEFRDKNIALNNPKRFAIIAMKTKTIYCYNGTTNKLKKPNKINDIQIKSIYKVLSMRDDDSLEFIDKIKSVTIPYLSKLKYVEKLDDEWSCESDSAFGTIE